MKHDPAPQPTKPVHVAVRLDLDTLARVDAIVPGLSSDWHRATRSDAVRLLLVEGLRAVEAGARKAKKGGVR